MQLDLKSVVQALAQHGYHVYHVSEAFDLDRYLDRTEFQHILWLDRLYQKIQSLPSHIIEIGVARGRNAVIFGHMIKMTGENSIRNYYGFDIFSGFIHEDLKDGLHLSSKDWRRNTKAFVDNRLKSQGLEKICYIFSKVIFAKPPNLSSLPAIGVLRPII